MASRWHDDPKPITAQPVPRHTPRHARAPRRVRLRRRASLLLLFIAAWLEPPARAAATR